MTEGKPIAVSVDATYSSRNNNSNHGIVSIVEHATPLKYLLHIEMGKASEQCTPQQLESTLTDRGLQYIVQTCEIPINIVAHDGKNIDQERLEEICGEVKQTGDP